MRAFKALTMLLLGVALMIGGHAREGRGAESMGPCGRMISAEIAAIDIPMMFTRLGAQNANWQVFALTSDLVTWSSEGSAHDKSPPLQPFSKLIGGGFPGY